MRDDWISPWWQAALLPARWDVCGVGVGSLSVWHTFALENIGCHYVCGGPCDRNDADSLLLVTSNDYQGGRRLMLDPEYRAKQMRRMHSRVARADWAELDAACVDFVRSCTRTASRWDRDGSRLCGVPYQWHLVQHLSGGDPLRLRVAWNTPYAVARALFDASAEHAGDDSIMSIPAQEMEDNWADYKDLTGTREVAIARN